nr:MAG TPA: hypothetical protein [Caudoviricetes sp.]
MTGYVLIDQLISILKSSKAWLPSFLTSVTKSYFSDRLRSN